MKERLLIYVALILSILALGYAAWVHHHAEQMATDALRKREAELVGHWSPTMRRMYLEMLPDTNAIPKDPKTLEELLGPMVTILESLGAAPNDAPKKSEGNK